jgi:hypothetical protein
MAAVETTGVVEGGRRTYMAGVAGMQRGVWVKQGADDNHVVPCTANAQPIGVLEESTINVGDPAAVIVDGEAVVIASAPFVAPAYLVSDANGASLASAAVGDQVGGQAVSSAAVAGDYAVARVRPFIR